MGKTFEVQVKEEFARLRRLCWLYFVSGLFIGMLIGFVTMSKVVEQLVTIILK